MDFYAFKISFAYNCEMKNVFVGIISFTLFFAYFTVDCGFVSMPDDFKHDVGQMTRLTDGSKVGVVGFCFF